jgi:phosphoglycolate phosphatase-like HAD superfamily hydrolase
MKLIVFDFDGTLVDSRKLILESHRVIQTAGVRGVAVSWGYHRSDRLRAAGASHVVDSMSELRGCLFEAIAPSSPELQAL